RGQAERREQPPVEEVRDLCDSLAAECRAHRQRTVLKNAQGVGLPRRQVGLLREPVIAYIPA
ncbi:MAG: hypothetical protein ACRD0W_08150, partial [Acidimicrobiales bacterium]